MVRSIVRMFVKQTSVTKFFLEKIFFQGDFNYNEIRIQFYEDFIYPEKLIIGFEKILTTKQHQWLITLAKEILKSKEKYLQRYDNDQDRNLAEYHVQAIAKGNIPLEYMTEETLEYPKKTLNFIDMLSLENAGTFEKTIEKRQFETLLEAAKERKEKIDNFLTVSGTKMTEVDKLEYAHLESIIAG